MGCFRIFFRLLANTIRLIYRYALPTVNNRCYSDSRANNAEAFFRNILTRDEERARRKLLIYFVAKSGADEIKQQFMLGLSADIMPALPFNFHAHTQNLLMAKLLSSYGSSSPSLTLSRWSWDVALRDHGISKLRIFVIMLG